MSADNNRLKSNLNQFDGKDKQQRMKIDELNQQMAECLEKLRAANKEKVMKKNLIFNWIINFKMKIAGSLIDVKLWRVSSRLFASMSLTVESPGGAGSREAKLPHKKARSADRNRRTGPQSRDD